MTAMRRRRFLAIAAAFCATAAGARPMVASWRGTALGADASLRIEGGPDPEGALRRALLLVREAEALFSLHDPASALSRLNAAGRLDRPPSGFLDLLAICDGLHRASGGAFDPTVQPLWRALATGGDAGEARAAIGWDRVRHDAGAVRLAPGQALTFNGVAQGWATDRVADALEREGYGRALVEIGEFRALGGPWRVGIEGEREIGALTLDGAAVATTVPLAPSGLPLGTAHVLSPDGLKPRWASVTVEADRAVLADGWSTALALMPVPARIPGVRRVWLTDAAGRTRSL